MIQNLKLPQWLSIVGQLCAGKSLVIQILSEWLKKNGIAFIVISSGDIAFGEIKTRTELMNALEKSGYKKDMLVLFEGSAMNAEELILMEGLIKSHFSNSFKVLDVLANNQFSRDRATERTAEDKRIELSKEDKPGVADHEKISAIMATWTKDANELIQNSIASGAYINVTNNSNQIELKNKLSALFLVD